MVKDSENNYKVVIGTVPKDVKKRISHQLIEALNKDSKNPKQSPNIQPPNMDESAHDTKNTPPKEELKDRKVLLADTKVGKNGHGIPDSRRIVPEENNPNQVKEYNRKQGGNVFYCVCCKNNKIYTLGKIDDTYFYAPLTHHAKCSPISRDDAERRLKDNEKRRNRSLSNTTQNRSRRQSTSAALLETPVHTEKHKYFTRSQSLSPQVTTVIEQNGKNININHVEITSEPVEKENCYLTRKRLSEDVLTDATPSKQQKLISANKIPYTDEIHTPAKDNQDATNIVSSETYKPYDAYKFCHPSTCWLTNACKKLDIKYTQNAYKFWGNIDINEIKDISKPEYVQLVKGGKNSCFRALSYLLSGDENKEVKTAIRNYFYDNFSTLGTIAGCDFATLTIHEKVIKDTILSEEMTPVLWETIAKWLKCRIGIFEDGKFSRFGSWSKNDDDETVTLLFEKVRDNYSIVMELTEI